MKWIKYLVLILLMNTAYSQIFKAQTFSLSDSTTYSGLGSNGISDLMLADDSSLFIATGNGLSVTQDGGLSFNSYYPQPGKMGHGGISAMTSLGKYIWIATVFDSIGVEEVTGTGSGISFSKDGGSSWSHIPQMTDHPDSNFVIIYGDTIDALPVTIPIDNITFDLAVHINSTGDTLLWATSFAGGTRVSRDLGQSWKRVILPADNMAVLDEDADLDFDYSPVDRSDLGIKGNFNHESFSVIAYNDTVVVGTAAGINISTDCGYTWRKYDAQNSGISGNFIVALHRGEDGTIYGGVLPALSSDEYQSLVYSKPGQGSFYWQTTLKNTRIYNITTASNKIFISSKTGAWVSSDGWSWVQLSYPIDSESGDMLYSDEIYSMQTDFDGFLWLGSGDGLAKTADEGLNWTLFRRVASFSKTTELNLSAYPNPFSPGRMNVYQGSGYVRFHCNFPDDGTATIDIYDFSMLKVKSILKSEPVPAGEHDFVWDGKNGMGDLVANAVYFVKLNFKSGSDNSNTWTKLIILE